MNIENLTKLAEVLESDEAQDHFNLRHWIHHNGEHDIDADMPVGAAIKDCGTVACIAGWAAVLANPDKPWGEFFGAKRKAALWLDLEWHVEDELFTPEVDKLIMKYGHELADVYEVSAKGAAKVVRHLIETGTVDWRVAFR
jgi:hypothetical protein